MKLKENILNSQSSKEFLKQLQSKYKDKVIKLMAENENVFLIKENEFYLGFLQLNFHQNKISIKLFLTSDWKNDLKEQLLINISDLIKNKHYDYLTFLHCFDSINILNTIDGIDFMHQYECNADINKHNPILKTNFNISTEISNYDELIDFHNLCYSDDKDYMISDWRKMLQSFPKAPLPKLTYICYNKDTIIGSIIGYIIPKKNKKYLYSICVHPDYRGNSIGEYLLDFFLQSEPLIPCYLTVYETAKPAINLYKKFGFKKINTVEAIIANEVKD
ncbi:MAG: GNAT family N-acetyltransferase [Candidatus Cloacimonetes bacterium]|jgi:ribosomal protein S18 acetylase RimI-like enzyme|nr:GNAT family N-acetyltransferase [Candidatus Cloacimonadota bacterium]MBT6993844.1 GNAT family N-acetyltransferase [Candidatus Cloacimonadota bacterium]